MQDNPRILPTRGGATLQPRLPRPSSPVRLSPELAEQPTALGTKDMQPLRNMQIRLFNTNPIARVRWVEVDAFRCLYDHPQPHPGVLITLSSALSHIPFNHRYLLSLHHYGLQSFPI